MLLSEGIGDTIRISLASDPVDEIKIGWDILKSLNIRSRGVKIIACPSCSRQNFNVINVVNELEERLEDISDDIEVAIIGCYVNGPGESKAANIGLTGASPSNLLYVDGTPNKKILNDNLVDELEDQVRKKVSQHKTESEKILEREFASYKKQLEDVSSAHSELEGKYNEAVEALETFKKAEEESLTPINFGLSSTITQALGEIDTSQSVNAYKASIILSGDTPAGK